VDPHRREICCAGRREDPKSKRPKRRVCRICGVAFSSKAVVLIHWPHVVDTAISNGPETYPRPLRFVIHFIAVMDTVISANLEVCLQPCQHTYVMDEAVAEIAVSIPLYITIELYPHVGKEHCPLGYGMFFDLHAASLTSRLVSSGWS
jgi:hypothetical protein